MNLGRLKFLSALAFFTALGFSPDACAEYRAFALTITNTKTGATRQVTSNLDDIQYPGYYPVRQFEKVSIQNSWMCWGRTSDFKSICPPPPDQPARAQ